MSETIATDSVFSATEQRDLRILAGLIVAPGAEFDVPGADDELIFADIVRSAPDVEAPVRAALAYARSLQAPLEEATAQLEGRPEMAPFVSLVMQCYYRDDRVMASIGMEARPPFPLGYEVEAGDWSMLEAVQARGKIWRDT